MGPLRRLGFAILLLITSGSAEAVGRGCASLMAGYVSPGQSLSALDLNLYKDANSALFLSDGLSAARWLSLGEEVSTMYPKKRIVSADFDYRGPAKIGNRELVAVNNTERFPFESNTFDVVVLRRGLCVCHGDKCCGGFNPFTPQSQSFFREAVRVMNKKNPDARIILHGSYGVTDNVVNTWKRYLGEIEAESNVEATMYFDDRDQYFMMIGIKPKFSH